MTDHVGINGTSVNIVDPTVRNPVPEGILRYGIETGAELFSFSNTLRLLSRLLKASSPVLIFGFRQ